MFGGKTFAAGATVVIAASLFVGQVKPAEAQRARGIAAGIGIGIGAAIILDAMSKEAQRQQRQQQTTRPPTEARPAKPSSPPTQQTWMSGADVTKMQTALKQLGYDVNTGDGQQKTRSAVRKFQNDSGQQPTGDLTRSQYDNLIQQARAAEAAPKVAEQRPAAMPAQPSPSQSSPTQATPSQTTPTSPTQSPARSQPVAPQQEQTASPSPSSAPSAAPAASAPRQTVTGSPPPAAAPSAQPKQSPPATPARSAATTVAEAERPRSPAATREQPAGPRVSADGHFSEYSGERVNAVVIERSSVGRRVPPAACAAACQNEARCKAYMSYTDGRCELTEEVESRVPDTQSPAEVAVLGVKRTIESAAAPR